MRQKHEPRTAKHSLLTRRVKPSAECKLVQPKELLGSTVCGANKKNKTDKVLKQTKLNSRHGRASPMYGVLSVPIANNKKRN